MCGFVSQSKLSVCLSVFVGVRFAGRAGEKAVAWDLISQTGRMPLSFVVGPRGRREVLHNSLTKAASGEWLCLQCTFSTFITVHFQHFQHARSLQLRSGSPTIRHITPILAQCSPQAPPEAPAGGENFSGF